MQEDLGQSLVAQSEFVSFKENKSIELGESLVAVSEKVYFQNASKINKQQYEKDKRYMKSIGEQVEEQSQNQFLQVGKWKKAKQNIMTKDMATVKKQVDQIITQSRWHKKQQQQPEKEEVIADESIVPDLDDETDKYEEIQDQTQQDDQSAQEQNEQQEQQSQEEQEDQQSQEEQEQSEQSQQQEQEQQVEENTDEKIQEIDKNEQQNIQMELSNTTKKQQFKVGSTINKSKINESNLSNIRSSKKIDQKSQSKAQSSQLSLDDRTDAQSQMKRTEYLPAKWNKKRQSQLQNQSQTSADPWKRKEAILKRILLLVK